MYPHPAVPRHPKWENIGFDPDAFSEPKVTKPIICCPKCGSQEFTLLNKGYSIFTGFLGSGKVKRVCNRCKKEF